MEESIIAATGNTKIPTSVLNHLEIKDGDKVRYFLDDDKVYIVPVNRSIHDFFPIHPKPESVATVEEMNDAIGESACQSHNKQIALNCICED